MITARPFIMRFVCGLLAPKKAVPGTAFVGTVAATGAEVTQLSTGDRVMAFDDGGAQCWAEQCSYPEDGRIGIAPESTSAEDIAACIEGIHYAENFLNKVPLEAGQSALVNGASGAIGSAMVQLLAARGADVVATCRSKDADLVMSLGARRCIDYEREDFTTENERFDYVFDAVGKSTFRRCTKLLKHDGFFLASELGPWLQNLVYTLITPWLPGPTVRFPYPSKTRESLAITKSLLEAGDVTAVIDQRHTFEQARQALTRAMSGDKVGNIVMTPGPKSRN